MADALDPKREPLQIDLAGRNPALFDALFAQLEQTLVDVVERLTHAQIDPSSREIMGELLGAAQGYVEARLKAPSIENQVRLAEITRLYAEAEERLAHAREQRASAERQELENLEKKLEVALSMMQKLRTLKLLQGPDGTTLDFAE
ncbi:MAG: hypothetical protein AAGI91_05870 [Bacteroidota bacterium]